MKLRIWTLVLLAIAAVPASSQPVKRLPYSPTDAEVSILPDYCQARLKGTEAAKKAWSQKVGPKIFEHLHHYCIGLNYMSRARLTINSRLRKEYYQTAANEFDYVLQRWPANFELTKHAGTQKSVAESMLKLKLN